MTKLCLKRLAVSAAFAFGLAVDATAQCYPGGPPNPGAQPNTIVGIVLDSSNRAVSNAEVIVNNPIRRTRTREDGRFVVEDIPLGKHGIVIRRIGYELAAQEVDVADSGGVARFCLAAGVRRLLPVISSAKRIGLGGVIGDSLYKPLPGAEVRVVAGASPVMTDSAGGFFIPLRPGTYGVLVSKAGFGRKLLSITIPKDSGREVAVWLGSIPRNPNRMFAAYDDMRSRILTANANRSAVLSAEKLQNSYDLLFAAQAAIRASLPAGCQAVIDGGPYTLPLATIDKEDVAMMEIYLAKVPRGAPPSINARGTTRGNVLSTVPPPKFTGCGLAEVYVWLK